MVLNTTGIEKIGFSAMQTLACRGETVVTMSFNDADDFYAFFDAHENNISQVIVDPERFEFALDVSNGVGNTPVVTLDIEVDEDGVPSFRRFDTQEE